MARQAQVRIDVEIGSIRLGPNVRVPAVATSGGGGGGGTGGGGGRGSSMSEEDRWRQQEERRRRRREFIDREFPRTPASPRGLFGQGGALDIGGNLAGAAGDLGLRRQLISLGYLGEQLAAITPQLMALVGVVGAVAVAVLGLVAAFKLSIAIVKTFAQVMLGLMKQCYDAVMLLGKGIAWVGQEVLAGTTRAVIWFGQKTVEATEYAIDQFKRMAEEGRRAYMELELGAAKVATVMGGIGDSANAAREDVMKFALDMSSKTQFAANEVADAMYEAFSAGFEGMEAVKGLSQASLELAAATQSQTGPVMEMLAATLNTFKINAEQSTQVADVFTAAIFRSAATMKKLIESMTFAGPVAATMGISLKETVAILEGFYQQGLQGSMAGTYFRQSVVALSKETEGASKAFKQLGVNFADLSVVKTGSVLKSLEMLEDVMRRVGKQSLNKALVQAFGARGGFGLMTLLNVGTAQIRKYLGQLDETGLTAQAAADQLRTLSGAVKLLTNLWTNFETKLIAGTVAQTFVWVIGVLQDLVKMGESSGALSALQNTLASIIRMFGVLAQRIGPQLIATIRDIANQIPGVVDALGKGLLAVLPDVLMFLRWLPGLFKYAFANVIPMLVRFGMTIVPLLIQLAQIALPLLVDVITAVGNAFVRFLTDNAANIVTWFTAFAKLVRDVVALLPSLAPIVNQLVNMFIKWAPVLLQTAVDALPALITAVQNMIPWLEDAADNVVPKMVDGMKQLAYFIGTYGVAAFAQMMTNLVTLAQWVTENWPTLMWVVGTGLALWVNGLSMVRDTLNTVLPYVKALVEYLRANWATVMDAVGEALERAFGFLGDMLQILPAFSYGWAAVGIQLTHLAETLVLIGGLVGGLIKLVISLGYAFSGRLDLAAKSFSELKSQMEATVKLMKDLGTGYRLSVGIPAAARAAADAGDRMREFGADMGSRVRQAPSAPSAGNRQASVFPGSGGQQTAVIPIDLGNDVQRVIKVAFDQRDNSIMVNTSLRGPKAYGTAIG